jgi:hypothetical protein
MGHAQMEVMWGCSVETQPREALSKTRYSGQEYTSALANDDDGSRLRQLLTCLAVRRDESSEQHEFSIDHSARIRWEARLSIISLHCVSSPSPRLHHVSVSEHIARHSHQVSIRGKKCSFLHEYLHALHNNTRASHETLTCAAY